jgi:hypothetical protein
MTVRTRPVLDCGRLFRGGRLNADRSPMEAGSGLGIQSPHTNFRYLTGLSRSVTLELSACSLVTTAGLQSKSDVHF